MAAPDFLPHVIHQNAQNDPDGIFARVPAGKKYSDGYRDVSKVQFARAVDYTASLIKQHMGQNEYFEAIAYIGPQDLRYSVVVIFLPSPRNSKEAHLSLLEKLECRKLIITDPCAPCVPQILDGFALQTMTLPSLQQLLEVEEAEFYQFERQFDLSHPAFVLHTSGSTGIPKHLTFTHDFISRVVGACTLPAPEGSVDINRYFNTGKFFMTLPSFHIAGLAYSLLVAAYLGSVPVYPLPGPPPTTESFIEAITHTDLDWAFAPPVVIDELATRADLLRITASRLKYLFFTGGSVPTESGDIVAKMVPIWQVLGSSECASLPLVHAAHSYNNSEDWNYVQLNPRLKSEMRRRFGNLHELVIVRDPETEDFQPVFAHFPEAKEYPTRDLFKPHPVQPGLWAHQGRIDDVIVFLNGEKTNPVTFEEDVIGHPDVKAALVVGSQRIEAALLVELADGVAASGDDHSMVIERLWPTVEKANKAAPAHARVAKDKILFSHPEKPLLRAGKGTVRREASLALYAEEIEMIYQQGHSTVGRPPTCSSAQSDIKSIIRDAVAELLDLDNLDFFQSGLDSLGVLRLQRILMGRLPDMKVAVNKVYSNPSVNALAKALSSSSSSESSPIEEITEILRGYSEDIDSMASTSGLESCIDEDPPVAILLMGSTGALGSHILHSLLSTPSVQHIYCFNRSGNSVPRQEASNRSRHLHTGFPVERVSFLTGDLTREHFGLEKTVYERLASEITHIVHAAWPVNFNLPLRAFRPSLDGVVQLVRFAAGSGHNIAMSFLSSISSVSSYPEAEVPEEIITDPSVPAAMGYGQAKHIAERLLDHASRELGLKTNIIRMGQVTGAASTTSGWNRQEWLPSLVISSGFLGALPESLGDSDAGDATINWVPIDHAAEVIVELALADGATKGTERQASVFHIAHPRPVSWSSLLEPFRKALHTSHLSSVPDTIRTVPYTEWVSVLKSKADETSENSVVDATRLAQMLPALKLLSFYDSLQHHDSGGLLKKLSIEVSSTVSPKLEGLEALQDRWVAGWVHEWMANDDQSS